MKKKLLSVMLAVALVLSFGLAAPVSAADGYGPEVTVPFGFSADGRPEFSDGNVSLVGGNLIVEFTAVGQNAKPLETNKHTAIFFDANIEDKDLSTASGFDMPWDEGNYVLVNNWFTTQDMAHPESLSWRQSFVDAENEEYECPWGSPVPGPGTMYSDSVDWPDGLGFVYELVGDDIKWTATVPISLLGVASGDTFGMYVAARDHNTDYGGNGLSLNGWPAMVYGFSAGYDLRDYALVTVPDATVTAETEVLADVIAISVTPTELPFGSVYRGQSSVEIPVEIVNTGTVSVDVSTSTGSAFYQVALTIDGVLVGTWSDTIAFPGSISPKAQVNVPSDWPAGMESGTIIFWAEATP